MKKIRLHSKLKKQIVDEFGVTYQTVSMSLEYVFNSKKAVAIRQRAKELLLKEADGIIMEINNQ